MDIIDIFTSGGMASIVGAIGGLFTKHLELKRLKLDNEHRFNMRRIDLEESKQERTHEIEMADKQMERAQVEGNIDISKIDANSFKVSQEKADKNTWLRPAVTIYLLLCCTWLMASVMYYSQGFERFPVEVLSSLFMDMVKTTLFLCVTAVTWWFASRPGNIINRVFK